MQTKGKPSENDRIIGQNLRNIRLHRGLSQDQLGKKIGVSFQQIQKYEKGTNRISGGRFIDLSHTLDVPIMAFFDGIVTNTNHAHSLIPKQHFQILNMLGEINDPEFEQIILCLCRNLITCSSSFAEN